MTAEDEKLFIRLRSLRADSQAYWIVELADKAIARIRELSADVDRFHRELGLHPDEYRHVGGQCPQSPAVETANRRDAAVNRLLNLPALSIRQPWAWAIVTIGKDIENRCWPTRFRGRFLIHAAKGCTQEEYLEAKEFIMEAVGPEYRGRGIVFPGWKYMQRGGVVGEAELVDCVRESESPWFVGEYGFVLRNVKPLPFTPCAGALGFFRVTTMRGVSPQQTGGTAG